MLHEHLAYLSDLVRRSRYQAAVARVIRGGEHVVDLGAGSGVLGLMCLKAGAEMVYTIDSTSMIEVARRALAAAGYGAKSVMINSLSTRASLPAKVDLVICDQVGFFGFDAGIVEYLADAQRRFLKPGGITIPRRIDLLLAPIQSERCNNIARGWRSERVPEEFHWVDELSVNSKHSVDFLPDELLAPAATLGGIELGIDQREYFEWSVEIQIDRAGTMHGLGGWFDCELAEGVRMTNSPTAPDRIQRSQAFLPLAEPLPVSAGDVICSTIMARPGDNLLSWQVGKQGSSKVFSQSTWFGNLISESEIALRDPAHVPRLKDYGRARNAILGLCDGVRSVSEIEAAVRTLHSGLFHSGPELSRFVASVLARDAE